MKLSGGAEILNEGTFTVNAQHSPAIEAGGGVTKVTNRGIFRKASGTGETIVSTPIENTGLVAAEAGKLAFTGGGSSSGASWEAAAGAEMIFHAGTYSIAGGALAGKIALNGSAPVANVESTNATAAQLEIATSSGEPPSLNVQSGTTTLGTLTLVHGSQGGPGILKISKLFSWPAPSTVYGSGKTIILPGAEGAISIPSNFAKIYQRQLVNQGTLTLSTGKLQMDAGAEILNENTFTANSEHASTIEAGEGEESKIVNSGVFQKTSGSGITEVQPAFENNGIIRSPSGTLKFVRPLRASGSEIGHECYVADPVNCATGDLREEQTDLRIGGRGVGLVLARTYSAQAAAAGSSGAFGYGWSSSFSDHLTSEEAGAKLKLTQGNGASVTFTKSGVYWLPPAWSQDTLTGSPESGYTLTLPSQVSYSFSGAGRLLSVVDRNGNQTTLAYDEAGRLQAITDPAGRQITFTYNAEGLVEKAEDPMGHVVKYAYEGKSLAKVTEPGEAEPRWQFKYDGTHRITTMTDGRGGKTINEYDSTSRVVSQTDPAERKTTFEYAPFHTKVTNKATGAVTDEWFTSDNEPVSITHGFGTPAATSQSFSYDSAGHLLSKTDGNGHATTYGYDEAGNLTSETDPLGHETKWAYNATHDLISTTTPGGETTTIKRDSHGNVESVSRPAPGGATQTASFAHSEYGQLTSITDPLEKTWTFGYDSYGDRTSETDPLGNAQTTAYDADSRLVSVTTPRGNVEGAEASRYTTTVERDAQGRLLKVTDPLGNTTKYAYDGNGNLASVTDAKGHTTKYTYNPDDERTKVEKPNGAVEETGYDGAGEIITRTNADAKTTTYARNALEEPVEVTDPLGRRTTKSYDADGNLIQTVDPAERTTSYSYDAAGRLTGVDYSEEATPDASFEYDADGNRVAMSDGTGKSSFAYDQLGRLTRGEDGHGDTVEYTYNLGEEQTGTVYPNGKTVSRSYDAAGRLESLTDWLGGTTSFGYDAESNLTGISFPVESGNSDEYFYDRASRMSEAKFKKGSETLASLSYIRDPLGQVEEEACSGLPGTEAISYGYDKNNRLIEAGAANFEYDAAGNMTKGIESANTYDAASQLEAGTGVTYSYDKVGERTKSTPSSGPATSYGYDQAGDLTSVARPEEGEVPGVAKGFAYDGTGLLVSKTNGLTTQHLTWDSSAPLPLLLDDEESSYLYGPNELPVEQISSGGEPTYLHHDQLGSTRLLTGKSGESSAAFSYAPFGGLEGATGSGTTSLGFAGQYTVDQSGLVYLRARYYDTATGQFLTLDPAVKVTHEPFAYAADNPLRFTDPSGLSIAEEIEGIGLPCFECGVEGLEELVQPAAQDAKWVLQHSLGAEELDEGSSPAAAEDEEEPCADSWEKGNKEIRDKGEQKRADERFVEGLERGEGTKSSNPFWPPSGNRFERIMAVLGKLIGQFHH